LGEARPQYRYSPELDKQRVALTFDEWHRGQVVMRLGEKASEAGYGTGRPEIFGCSIHPRVHQIISYSAAF